MRLLTCTWLMILATLAVSFSTLALPCPPTSSGSPSPSSSNSTSTSAPKSKVNTTEPQDSSGNSTLTGFSKLTQSNRTSLSSGMAQLNGVGVGFLPDDGSGQGGRSESMSTLITNLGGLKPLTYGRYAQIKDASFDGSQLLSSLPDIKASGAILEAAIMPVGGFSGFSGEDTSKSKAVVEVLKKFVQQGIKVRLRFGHEMNYYLADGTYPGGTGEGTANAFREAWSGLTEEVRKSLPGVDMFWTPNIEGSSDLSAYTRYMPSLDEVDLCGVDWYPQTQEGKGFGDGSFYASKVKALHDACTAQGARWAVGETGLAKAYDLPTRLSWLKEVANSKAKGIDKLDSISWFDYYKDYDFRIAGGGGDVGLTKRLLGGGGQ